MATLSAILKASMPYGETAVVPRPRICVRDLLSPSSDDSEHSGDVAKKMRNAAHVQRTVMPTPTPVPVALHRLSKENVQLAPLQPRHPSAMATGHGSALPHIYAAATPTTKSSVVLVDDDPMSPPPNRARPVKRTSEDYKHSHMLAERKRRKEMKVVFEELAALLPATGTASKRSKWETLADTIDYLDGLELRKRALISRIKASSS